MPENTNLLPCPFCGSAHNNFGYVRDGERLMCNTCHATFIEYHGPKDNTARMRLAAKWNTRPDPNLIATHALQRAAGRAKGLKFYAREDSTYRAAIDVKQEIEKSILALIPEDHLAAFEAHNEAMREEGRREVSEATLKALAQPEEGVLK